MPTGSHKIVFARIVPSELNIVTTENNNRIDLALCVQVRNNGNANEGGVTQAAGILKGADLWQTRTSTNNVLSWNSFVESFYGGGDGDFGISQVAGRRLTMIGVSGEYANGVPQASSALTHLADRGRTDNGDGQGGYNAGSDGAQGEGGGANTSLMISGVSVLNDVVDSVVHDLGLPHEAWDSCSYMNVVNQLQDVHTLADVTRIQGKLQQTCSLSMHSLVHEIASNYDENMGINADNSATSAVYKLYNSGLEAAISIAMKGDVAESRHVLVLSVMFKNSTPGVRNVEFRLHFIVCDDETATEDLTTLCGWSCDPAHFELDGTQN